MNVELVKSLIKATSDSTECIKILIDNRYKDVIGYEEVESLILEHVDDALKSLNQLNLNLFQSVLDLFTHFI